MQTSTGTIPWAFEGFILDRTAALRSERTISFYQEKMKRFRAYLAETGVNQIDDLTIQHVRQYMDLAHSRGMSPATMHCEARSIRAFLRWAACEDLIDPRLPAKLKMPRVPRVLIKPFSLQQIEKLLAAAKKSQMPERDTAILLTLFDTGIRASELCGLRDEDVDGDRLKVFGKGAKERWVPISTRTRKAIWKWQAKRGHSTAALFQTRTGEAMCQNSLSQLFNHLRDEAKIDGVRCSPHTCRHTTALEWVRDGAGTFELRKLLGHETLAMTQRYVATSDADVAKAHREHSLVEKLARRSYAGR